MPSPHWIDWTKHRGLVENLRVGVAGDGLFTPLLRIRSLDEGVPEQVVYPFIPQYLDGRPLAWIVRESRDYLVITNCVKWVEHDTLLTYDPDGKSIMRKQRMLEAVVFGPFKSIVSAIKKVRELA